ncbi:hypothetical protein [Micromonospora inaquosa]|uniref:Uncharacterized protein n=1 Tax=Micromonospora inaquosa TaxID=2203716 RepID=A0A3N9X7Y4_9ACTN|nr:hypothetical protein [Micromonospora inaquosa]RQX09080.1 hypothetical protein DLJ59_01230 [Micromonospora inaquosa]
MNVQEDATAVLAWAADQEQRLESMLTAGSEGEQAFVSSAEGWLAQTRQVRRLAEHAVAAGLGDAAAALDWATDQEQIEELNLARARADLARGPLLLRRELTEVRRLKHLAERVLNPQEG